MSQTPAGWYPDANGTIRWWDGAQWTEHTQPPAAPAAPAVEQPAAAAQPPDDDRTMIRRPVEDAASTPAAPQTPEPSAGPSWTKEQSAPYPTSAPPAQPPGPWAAGAGQQPQGVAGSPYAQPSYQAGQGSYPAYGQWPGSTTPKRTIPMWLVVTVGVVVLLIVVGLVLFFTLRGGSDDSTSSQDFCSALEALPDDASLADAIAAVKSKGLPADMPTNAKHGFDLYVQYASQLSNAQTMTPAQKAQIVGGSANLADMQAFDTYVDQTCGTSTP